MSREILKSLAILAVLTFGGCQEGWSVPSGVVRKVSEDTFLVQDTEGLKSALSQVSAGGTVIWKDGVYNDVKINFSHDGTSSAPVTLRAETPGGVLFKGQSSIKLSGTWLVAEGFSFTAPAVPEKGSILTFAKGSSYCRISSCRIDGSVGEYSDVDTKWISIYGHHNEIDHCSFLDKRNMGCLMVVWMEDGIIPYHSIHHNYFTRPYTHRGDDGKALNSQEALRIGTSTYSLSDACCEVHDNHFYHCHGELAEIISNKSCRNVYTRNLFELSDGSLTLRHGNACHVKGNYFLSAGSREQGGVRIIGEDHVVEENILIGIVGTGYKAAICLVNGESGWELNGYAPVKNAVVRNNVFVDCVNPIVNGYGARSTQDTAPQGVVLENNRSVSGSGPYEAAMDQIRNGAGIKW